MTPADPLTPVVWITPGCTRCHWCQNLMPTVFTQDATGSVIRGEARSDGVTDSNATTRTPLSDGLLDPASRSFLQFIADGCPARVIHLTR